MDSYRIPSKLLQEVVNTLNHLPAGQVRLMLNAIEQTCNAQDAEFASRPPVFTEPIA